MQKKLNIWGFISTNIANIFLFLILVVFTFIMTDGYFNISITKRISFYAISALFILMSLIKYRLPLLEKSQIKSPGFIFVAVLLVETYVGIIGAEEKGQAFIGKVEYGLGPLFLTIMLIDVLYFAGREYSHGFVVKLSYFIIIVSSLFAFLQFVGIDVFLLRKDIGIYQPTLFISTLGNLGLFGIYLVIFLPIIIYGYINEIGNKVVRIFAVMFEMLGIVISNTDATIITFFVVMFVCFYLVKNDLKCQKRFYDLLFITGATWFAIGVVWTLWGTTLNLTSFYALQKFVVSYKFSILIAAIGLLVGELIRIEVYGARTAVFMGWLALVIGIAIVPVYALSTIIYTKVFDPAWGVDYIQPLFFNERWGSYRGFIWMSAVDMIKGGSLLQIIFGHGTGSFSPDFLSLYEEYVKTNFSAYFNDAHNIYLQWTYEYGIVGLFALVGSLVCAIKGAITSANSFKTYAAIGVVAFAIASAFFVCQCISPVYLLLLICLIVGENK